VSDIKSVMDELIEIKQAEENSWDDDIVKRTISSLLAVEKKALYGSLRGKQKKMEEIIISELSNYRELENANKED